MPIQFNWDRTHAWDRDHCNIQETKENELHSDCVNEAIDNPPDDERSTFCLWENLAIDGSVYSMAKTAYLFEAGIGIKKDLAKAEYWYAAAFAGGSQWGLLRCASLMASRKDFKASAEILSTPATEGWVPAMFWLAWYKLKDSQSAERHLEVLPLLEKASADGHPGAQWYLGRLMAWGKYGADQKKRGRKIIMDLSSDIVSEIDHQEQA